MASYVQAPVIDQSHGHTYNAYAGGNISIHVGATMGSSGAPGASATTKAPRRHRRCPAPSVHYTRRQDIEDHMDGYFFGNQPGAKRYVLYGLGGSGKTQVANAFVYQHYYDVVKPQERRFSDVFCVDATSIKTINDSLQDIAEAVNVKASDVLAWFANHDGDDGNWIIIFNNAEDPNLELSTYFPDCSHGNILITTRNSEAKRFGVGPNSAYAVASMMPNESRDLLLSHLRPEDISSSSVIDDITHLAQELGHFPLSLSQAGAFMVKTHFTPTKYLTMLRKRRTQLLKEQGKMKNPDQYDYTSIQAAWLISFEKLSPPARQLLWLCAFLHHDGIMQTIFEYMITGLDNYERWYCRLSTDEERIAITRLKEFRKELLTNGIWDEFKFHELISELQSFSLISFIPEQQTWSIHPSVHEWARDTIDKDKQVAVRQQALILLSCGRGRTKEEMAFDGLLALHVDEALKGRTPEFNGCRNEFGFIYRAARRWDDEVMLRIEYKEACERILGEDDDNTLRSISLLAVAYRGQGLLNDAATLECKVMEAWKRKLGEDNLVTLQSMANLAGTYWKQGRLNEAATLEFKVMEARQRKLGDDHLDTLESMANLASTYWKQGRLDDAAKLELKVVEVRKEKLGYDHLDTLQSMANLAATYRKQDLLDDAAKMELEVMEVRKRKLGDDHLETLESMANLASTYWKQGRLDDAATLELKVVKVRKRKLGHDHLDTLQSMANLAATYSRQGRFDDASSLYLEVMEARKRRLGSDHLDTLWSMDNLAITYRKHGRLDDAATLEWEAMEIRKRKLAGWLNNTTAPGFQAKEGSTYEPGADYSEIRLATQGLDIIHRGTVARNRRARNRRAPNAILIKDSEEQVIIAPDPPTPIDIDEWELSNRHIEICFIARNRNTGTLGTIPNQNSEKQVTVLPDPPVVTCKSGYDTRHRGARIIRYFQKIMKKLTH